MIESCKKILFNAVLSKTGLIGLNEQTDKSCFIKRIIYFYSYKVPLQSPLDMKVFEWLKCYCNDWFMKYLCNIGIISLPWHSVMEHDHEYVNMLSNVHKPCLTVYSIHLLIADRMKQSYQLFGTDTAWNTYSFQFDMRCSK